MLPSSLAVALSLVWEQLAMPDARPGRQRSHHASHKHR
jgi:hypothetical protein